MQGQGPGPRYGHVMDLVAQRYLVTVSGNDGEDNSVLLLIFWLSRIPCQPCVKVVYCCKSNIYCLNLSALDH